MTDPFSAALLAGANILGALSAGDPQTALARVVLDYVAGMTDRFALQEHAR
ncbi:MAG: hypothetical protein H5U17_05585, partial [Defluviimonas sp.]|nr:hypothetical protein [Defluviimonas sp.]